VAPGLATTLVQPRQQTTDAKTDLPPELLLLSSQRLGTASIVYAVAYLLDYVVNRVAYVPYPGEPSPLPVADAAALLAIPIALAVFLAVRSGRFEPRQLCRLGLVFEVLGALGIAIQEQWIPWDPAVPVRGISWVCVWIVFFPIIVPSTTKKALAASFAAATTVPLAFLISVAARGSSIPTSGVLVDLFEPPYLCALFAPLSAHIIHQVGRAWSEARKLGSYELVERLGTGGMGEVWRGRHQMLARPAAIKVIRSEVLGLPAAESAKLLRQFEREAQATATLQSPHSIQLFDFGVSDEGSFFYVMELLDGLDLDTLVSRFGPIRAERVIHLLGQVCHSLRDAHQSGLIHRDVKPANIFVCRKGADYDFVKVLDFGLVKALGVKGAIETTAGRVLAGTPAFLPPELAIAPEKADHRVDIYSLGCVAYWMLTGRLVFEADTTVQMIGRHLQDEPVPPSQYTELDIPAELEQLVLHCLAKDPDARPQTMEAVMTRLAACPSARAWTSEQAKRWWETHEPSRNRAG
jgi:serine/threonine-protein kinase